jgi:hypothetical protein
MLPVFRDGAMRLVFTGLAVETLRGERGYFGAVRRRTFDIIET